MYYIYILTILDYTLKMILVQNADPGACTFANHLQWSQPVWTTSLFGIVVISQAEFFRWSINVLNPFPFQILTFPLLSILQQKLSKITLW